MASVFFKKPQFLGVLTGSKLPSTSSDGSTNSTSAVHPTIRSASNTDITASLPSSSPSSSHHEDLSGAVRTALNGWRVPRVSPLFRNTVHCEDKKAWPDNERYAVRDSGGGEDKDTDLSKSKFYYKQSNTGSGNAAAVDKSASFRRGSSKALKKLKEFHYSVDTATVAANRPCEDRISICEFELDPDKDPLVEGLTGDNRTALLCSVFDGHGGYQVAQFLDKHLKLYFQEVLNPYEESGQSAEDSLRHAYRKSEKNLWSWFRPVAKLGFSGVVKVGACACSAVLLKKENEVDPHRVVIANAGDCRCVLGTGGRAVGLTNVHNANNDSERKALRARFPNESDVVQCHDAWKNRGSNQLSYQRRDSSRWEQVEVSCYIKGCLQPSRTFGDFYLKYPEVSYDREMNTPFFSNINRSSFPYITAEPEIMNRKLKAQDDFIVMGSDGLWDFLSDEEIVQIVYKNWHKTESAVAQILLDKCLAIAAKESNMGVSNMMNIPPGGVRRRLHDDTSIIVIRLKHTQGEK